MPEKIVMFFAYSAIFVFIVFLIIHSLIWIKSTIVFNSAVCKKLQELSGGDIYNVYNPMYFPTRIIKSLIEKDTELKNNKEISKLLKIIQIYQRTTFSLIGLFFIFTILISVFKK